jgi:branched-chain amino acid transport system permease protein
MLFCIFVLSFDLLYGQMGHLSFGVMLYYGTGAYTAAICMAHVSTDPFWAIAVAVAVSSLTAAILGSVAVRTHGAAFALINMAFNEIGFFAVRSLLQKHTKGDDGLSFIADPLFGVLDFYQEAHSFILVLAVLVAVYAFLKTLSRSPFGILIRSIRENEIRVSFLGYNTLFYKWVTFVIASSLAGLAGALFACVQGFVSPEVMSPFSNVNVIFAVLIGGAGYLYGSLGGALVFMLIKNYLPIWASEAGKLVPFKLPQWEMWLGIVLLIIVFTCRKGVVGLLREKLAGRGA